MKKRIISILTALALALCLSQAPAPVWAWEEEAPDAPALTDVPDAGPPPPIPGVSCAPRTRAMRGG